MARSGRLSARWDAAQTTDENRKHWALVDALSADAAASPSVRRTLRNRARYEVANNSYAQGIVTTVANDTVGTGARLQLLGLEREQAVFVEQEFCAWAEAVGLAEKLRTMRRARAVDGEAFAIQIHNARLPTRVKLDLRLIEAEMVSSWWAAGLERNTVDGIHFDEAGNPTVYEVLREHPGSGVGTSIFGETDDVPWSQVLHYFAPDRAGQRRGVPELTPALPLFAQLRRWTLSVLAAAETASDFSALLQTELPPDGEAMAANPFESLEIERRMMMTLPAGWKMNQLKAEQPVSTYAEFKHEIINEIARSIQVPYNVAAGNSSSYNYSSGRLDFQVYFKALKVERMRMREQVLERVFAAWKQEAVLIEGYLDQSLRLVETDWSHDWFWDGSEHVDPEKEANAQETRLRNKTTTLADEWGRAGADWEAKLEQIAKERAKARDLEEKYGISMTDIVGPPAAPKAAPLEDPAQNGDTPAAPPRPRPGYQARPPIAPAQKPPTPSAAAAALASAVESVSAGRMAPSAAKALLCVSFPHIAAGTINQMVDDAAAFTPREEPKDEPAPAPVDDPPAEIVAAAPAPADAELVSAAIERDEHGNIKRVRSTAAIEFHRDDAGNVVRVEQTK